MNATDAQAWAQANGMVMASREYLASSHWRWTRRRAIQMAGHRCQHCHEMEHGLPEHLTTTDGPELFGKILRRMVHSSTRQPARKKQAG